MIPREHSRQARLLEVRVEGQARIARARFDVRLEGEVARSVATTYLERAGAGNSNEEGDVTTVTAEGLGLVAGADEVARGALASLVALRHALGLGLATDTVRVTGREGPEAVAASNP